MSGMMPGYYPGLRNDEYHADPAISKTKLDVIGSADACPKKYWARFIDPNAEPYEPTKAMFLGAALHVAVLEPDNFYKEYAAAPEGIDRRFKEGKARWAQFEQESKGKKLLTADEHTKIIGARDAVRRCPEAMALINGADIESSYFAEDPATGLMVRARPDIFHRKTGVMVDLKRTVDASEEGFGRSASEFRYDVQGAWYPYVVNLATREQVHQFKFIAVESEYPYVIGIYDLQPEDFIGGLEQARRDLETIAECYRTGAWPDHSITTKPLRFPPWHKRRIGSVH